MSHDAFTDSAAAGLRSSVADQLRVAALDDETKAAVARLLIDDALDTVLGVVLEPTIDANDLIDVQIIEDELEALKDQLSVWRTDDEVDDDDDEYDELDRRVQQLRRQREERWTEIDIWIDGLREIIAERPRSAP